MVYWMKGNIKRWDNLLYNSTELFINYILILKKKPTQQYKITKLDCIILGISQKSDNTIS